MAFPWGGSVSHAQLARKFGWWSVILSFVLFPLTAFIRNFLAFPFFLSFLYKDHKTKAIYKYPNDVDCVRTKVYKSETQDPEMECCPGLVFLVDEKGGKWFEYAWGLISIFDLKITNNGNTWNLINGWKSIPGPTAVELVYAEDGKSHSVTFTSSIQQQPLCSLYRSAIINSAGTRFMKTMSKWLMKRGGSIGFG